MVVTDMLGGKIKDVIQLSPCNGSRPCAIMELVLPLCCDKIGHCVAGYCFVAKRY
jgi:hypothetical protein